MLVNLNTTLGLLLMAFLTGLKLIPDFAAETILKDWNLICKNSWNLENRVKLLTFYSLKNLQKIFSDLTWKSLLDLQK